MEDQGTGSCSLSVLWILNTLGRDRIHQVSMWGTLFSTSKIDSLDKKQIQIIVVIVVKLIFYYQNTDMSVFFCISRICVSLHQIRK